MDSDAYLPGRLVVTALARDGPTAVDRRHAAGLSTLIPSGTPGTGPPPETVSSEAFESRAQARLNALVGALALRAVRARYPR